MTTPKVSIIVPVYNAEKYLSECLDAIFNQSLKDIEVIIVNDGSTDTSWQIVQEYTKKHKNRRENPHFLAVEIGGFWCQNIENVDVK